MDDDDKARRNLVVASALVIASAWLEIPFSSVIQKFVDHSIAAPDSSRVLAAGLAILAYLGLRYRSSEDGTAYSSHLKTRASELRKVFLRSLGLRQLNEFIRTGKQPKSIMADMRGLLVAHNERTSPDSHSTPQSRFQLQSSISLAAYEIEAEVVLDDRTFVNPKARHRGVKVAATGITRWMLELKVQIALWTVSKEFVHFLIPVLMGCVATLILFSKVVSAYWLTLNAV